MAEVIHTVAGVPEGVLIMFAYRVLSAFAGPWLFEREEFT